SLVVEGSGKDAVVSLYTYNTEGNAVVKIYKKGDADKTALWSWHIWVTGYDPAQDNGWNPKSYGGTTTRNVSFMDRNLGALEAANSVKGCGLYYQWGRKDPFPAKDNVGGFGIADGGSGVTIVQAIQNPGTFYGIASGVNNDDWLSTKNDTLWGGDDESKPKTIYDPCPAGWRVPFSGEGTSSPWYGFGSQAFISDDAGGYVLPVDNNGGQYTQSYWPAAGLRSRLPNSLISLGAGGNYWSATCRDTDVYDLAFNSSDFASNHFYDRANGMPVRCVKEITP
ncbi:MAG: hypothetical protein LBG18_00035, partial [Mediterranea sp.]|nr:hypothetical protein [Mediterranea sp.]